MKQGAFLSLNVWGVPSPGAWIEPGESLQTYLTMWMQLTVEPGLDSEGPDGDGV